MHLTFEGRARKVGDDVNTDYIIASTRKKATLDASVLKQYLLESIDPTFAASVQPGDLLVAGRNFGCGSAMEIAVTVILAAGIKAVVAESFARTFFRNAVNNGLIPIECSTSKMVEGETLSIEIDGASVMVTRSSGLVRYSAPPMPEITQQILDAGGLVSYLRHNGGHW